MADQITNEGGADLAPAAPSALAAEGAGNLTPAAPGAVAAAGGADLSPDAPADLSPQLPTGGSIVITGDATVEIYDSETSQMIPRPIAGTYHPTGTLLNGKQTYTADGGWPHSGSGVAVAISHVPPWSILVYFDGDGGLGWTDNDELDVESPLDVVNWTSASTVAGSFALEAGPSGVTAPDAIAAAGGADLSPGAPGGITPESPY